MKIAILGGGAMRLLGVLDEVLKNSTAFDAPHIVLMDLDLEAVGIVVDLARMMPSAADSAATIEATDDMQHALEGADFVYCCIRVGGVRAMERDKKIAIRHGYHGHDDYGPSAVMLTWRTVPVVLDIAAHMERLCPKAMLLIFTNPIATLVDAVERHTPIRSVGLCPGVYNFAYDMDHLLGIGTPYAGLKYRGGGLNHVSWVCDGATLDGEPVLDMVLRRFDELGRSPGAAKCGWQLMAPLIKLYGALVLNNGHQNHYFYHDELARKMAEYYANTPENAQRNDSQLEARRAAGCLAAQERIENFWEQPPLDKCKASAFGDIGVHFMEAMLMDSGRELGVTTPNHGHIRGVMEGATVEAHARITRDRIEPLDLDPIPDALKGLCQAIAAHQRCLVDASVRRDREALLRALLSEPTIRSYDRAKPMFDELWAADAANAASREAVAAR